MMILKYFLLLLGSCGIYYADAMYCSTTGLRGRPTYFPHKSSKSILPAGHRQFKLEIPNGYYMCYPTEQKYLVGEKVVVCDYDYPPSVQFENRYTNTALVYRYGRLQQNGTAHTIYYCDYKP